jgi:hypothetical protein
MLRRGPRQAFQGQARQITGAGRHWGKNGGESLSVHSQEGPILVPSSYKQGNAKGSALQAMRGSTAGVISVCVLCVCVCAHVCMCACVHV